MHVSYGAYAAYRNTAVQTATPEGLLIMLYDGLVRFTRQARAAIVEGDVPNAHTNLRKAQDIVVELRNTLKMEYEISHALAALYDWFYKRLLEANVEKSVAPLDDILPRIEELREAWVEAARIVRSQSAQGTGTGQGV
ncbi:MAG: flagellar export chaperone FliS [Alicyclobacillus sp.]|nr:flagellar export chaperone FliS [Alicyclobacillus sp.]